MGQDNFVSADNQGGGKRGNQFFDALGSTAAEDEEKTVEQGDIYRLYGEGLLLNLNYYRGLQVIDIADPDNPALLGRYAITGEPVEMYVVGDKAVLLLNNWQAYSGSGQDLNVDYYAGGLVVTVDLSNNRAPTLVSKAEVPGWIMTSRLTRGSGHQALYVAATNWGGSPDGTPVQFLEIAGDSSSGPTVVQSFEIEANGSIQNRSRLELGGWVQDIAATTDYLMVARYDSNFDAFDSSTSTVSLIDISDVTGLMVEGAQVQAAGHIAKKTDMDVYEGILRIASGSWWNNINENHLETFDIADIDNPVPVSHLTFGEGEQLYATLFLGNKAFFVTYQRVDPFHAFEIDARGNATERAEFVISGWNDWFRPVMDASRLIGIGRNDTNGWTMAVSLYDITDITNPNPFLARADIDAQQAWSEASWDDRAFSVVENAVSVPAKSGDMETGLVLLPFSGFNPEQSAYSAGVQIFTFSENTLTKRGLMVQGSFVRRSFLSGPSTTANLSDSELKLFNTADPDAPSTLGSLALAPAYSDFFLFGDYGARLVDNTADYWYWTGDKTLPPNRVEIVPMSGDLETTVPVASFLVPANSQLFQVGHLLVSVIGRWVGDLGDNYETTLTAYDLSNPLAPQEKGTLVTEELPHGYFSRYWDSCWGWRGCGYHLYGNVHVAGESMAFIGETFHEKTLGTYETCTTRPDPSLSDCPNEIIPFGGLDEPENTGPDSVAVPSEGLCTSYYGSVSCTSYNGGPADCIGSIYSCELDLSTDVNSNCVDVNASLIPTQTQCAKHPDTRYWSSYEVSVVDLRNPVAPALQRTIAMPSDQEAGGVLVVNLENPTAPFVQAFYPLRGWPNRMLLEGNDIIVPADKFGLYRFNLDETNLTESIQ